jgi:large subunit ribosomal protein L9
MKLILNSDVNSLGRKGDIVNVAKGYARNYLLPKKLAIMATTSNLELAEKIQ